MENTTLTTQEEIEEYVRQADMLAAYGPSEWDEAKIEAYELWLETLEAAA